MPNFTISPTTGTGVTTIHITPAGQNTTYSPKISTITITDGTSTKNVQVKQNGLPHTVPATDVINATSAQQDILFGVESDFIIQFSGYTPGETWVSIWDTDSGEELSSADWYWPEDLTGAGQFALRIQQNRTGSARTITLFMRHYYNNAGDYDLAPYVYTMVIRQE